MRYIDTSSFTPPAAWLEKAKKAYVKTESETNPKDRSRVVRERAYVWAELKASLATLSNNKCWYCETEQERSDNHVDHFRPKNQVAECKGHRGYWWLAFEWTNYRFCCTYCNSRRVDEEHGSDGGKQDHFPLFEEGDRAYCPEDDIASEDPCLLDPTVAMDPVLLWFNDEGRIVPKYPDNVRGKLRAEKSIELYHLNYFATEQKRLRSYRDIRDSVAAGKRAFRRAMCAATRAERESAEELLIEVIERLMKAIASDRQFSVAARTYLMGFRDSEHDWIDSVLRGH